MNDRCSAGQAHATDCAILDATGASWGTIVLTNASVGRVLTSRWHRILSASVTLRSDTLTLWGWANALALGQVSRDDITSAVLKHVFGARIRGVVGRKRRNADWIRTFARGAMFGDIWNG